MRPLAVLPALLMAGSAFAQVPPSPRLSGIIVTPEQRTAIVAFDRDGASLVASEGMTVGPWTILGITEHQVEVATPSGKEIVVPDARAPVLAAIQPSPTGDAMFDLRPR